MPSDHHDEPAAPPDLALYREEAMLLVVDVQERLFAAMPEPAREQVSRNVQTLIRAAHRLDLPVVATEQYPRGLGPTIEPLRALLKDAPLEKLEFSCGMNKAIARQIMNAQRRQVIVLGMEAHVCVYQTVRDLLRGPFSVYVPRDAVLSRAEGNLQTGLSLCEKAGAILTSTETIVFDLLSVAGTPEFKELSALLK